MVWISWYGIQHSGFRKYLGNKDRLSVVLHVENTGRVSWVPVRMHASTRTREAQMGSRWPTSSSCVAVSPTSNPNTAPKGANKLRAREETDHYGRGRYAHKLGALDVLGNLDVENN